MKKYNILLIEDSADDVELIHMALDKHPNIQQISIKQDGKDALDYLFKNGKYKKLDIPLPQLVILDINMPRFDGFSVLEEIRKNKKTNLLPVTIFTSSIQPSDLIRSYQLGANSYIRKPVDFDEFKSTIQRICTYWLEFNHHPHKN